MPESNDVDGNLLVSSPNLSIWSTWVNLTRCFSVIKNITPGDHQIDSTSVTGASAVLFVLSDHIPIELQKEHLLDLISAIPSDSCLPLLIVSSSGNDKFEIGLDEIDKSRVVLSYISLLKNGGSEKFLSDECLREGLEWLASESPPQINVRGIQTRDLVLSNLNSIEIFNSMNNTPNNCIWAFNEALDRSMLDVSHAVRANPTNWPCPEIYMLDESRFLPSIGWSSASKTRVIMNVLDDLKLPAMEDDLLFLSEGVRVGHDIEKQKSRLESCLIEYLTKTSGIMGVGFAHKEVSSVIQKFTRLELCDGVYYIVPDWGSIFKRIFSWRMMSLTKGEELYVLADSKGVVGKMESKVEMFLSPCYVVKPSFDEMIEAGGFGNNDVEYEDVQMIEAGGFGNNDVEYEDVQTVVSSPMGLDCVDDVRTSYEYVFGENDDGVRGRQEEAKGGGKGARETEADKLTKLLERCTIVQDMIDEKLSMFFL